ncbi:MAG: C25 family cysteine peptidase [Acidobacteriota bacterium]
MISTRRNQRFGPGMLCVLMLGHSLLIPAPAWTGGTPATGALTDQLQTVGAGGANASTGDYIASFRGTLPVVPLDETYEYFVEVTTGATALEIDIFDADVLAGAGDITGERDQNRTSATPSKSRYRLFDPAGDEVATRFSYGDQLATNPPGADNAWKLFYDNTTAGVTGGDVFLDTFSTAGSYAGDDSTGVTWATDWIESDDLGDGLADDPAAGDVLVTGGELSFDNQADVAPFTNQPSVEREADLSSYAAALLSFDWRTDSGVDRIEGITIGDSVAIEVSSDGGVTYTVIDEFGGLVGVQSGSAIYDITDFIAVNTRIRLRITNRYAAANETIFFDDVQIRGSTTANGPAPTAGHWRIEVDMTGDVNGHLAGVSNTTRQDDVNAFGLRAHDGNPGAGGQEYNLYAESYIIVGINDNGRQRTYDFHPYVTSGCTFESNNWDWDGTAFSTSGNMPPYGDIDYASRSGAFTDSNATMSANNSWATQVIPGGLFSSPTSYVSNDTSDEYGIWSADVRIEDFGQNNYGPVYFGAHDVDPQPPAAQPEPNTFRIYFPNDGGLAPAKPYLSQYLRFVPGQSPGPNPPAVGQTSRYAMSLVVTNPTGSIGTIDFSPTRLVTGHIPGGEVLYGGVSFLSQGSVVSQPAIGASGDITWNPGALAPGVTATLTYFVDVTPVASPATIVVTGTVGSGNGTRATWLDETGDDTNGTGAFEFGELCSLRITTPDPPLTQAMIASFDAVRSGADVVVEWRTAGEVKSVGFDLYRQADGGEVRVNDAPLGAHIGHLQGGVYRFLDDSAPAGPLTYRLVEREASGVQRAYGPFRIEPRAGDVNLQSTFESAPHPPQAQHFERLARAEAERVALHGDVDRRGSFDAALRLEVGETGLYRLTAAEIAAAWGLRELDVRRLIARTELQLTVGGEEVTWIRGQRGATLDFVGYGVDTPFTDTNVYRLSIGSGRSTTVPRRTLPPPPDWSDSSFAESRHYEDATLGVTLLPLDPEGDTWIWRFVRPSTSAATFPARVPAPVADADDATLRLELFGGTAGGHLVAVRVNGQEVGQLALDDFESLVGELSVPAALLVDGDNTVEVESVAGDLVFIDSFDLDYERWLRPDQNQLAATAERGQVSVAPFTEPSIRVFDTRDPLAPRPVISRVIAEGAGHRAIWQSAGGSFLTVADSAIRTPAIFVDEPSDLGSTAPAVDYLVITTADLAAAAEQLTALRSAQGLATRVVDIQDVYDEFSDGLRDPRAIRSLITHALENWQRAPRYVVLAGAGTYDHRDFLGLGGSPIPVLQASDGDGGLYASDATFGDVDGDGLMDVAVGRIPVLAASELEAYAAKVATYEAGGDWLHRVTTVADTADGETVFAEDGLALASLLPAGYEVTAISLDASPLADARQALFDSFTAGSTWVHYSGHGGPDRWSDQALLTSGDVANLDNAGALPVVSSATCLIGLHALPGFDALGEFLVLDAEDGAVAVLAPTWNSHHDDSRFLGDRFFRQVFQREVDRLGDALLTALSSAASIGVEPELLRSYQILGDPAIRLQRRPVEQVGTEICLPGDECDG